MGGGVLFGKKWTFPQRTVHYVQYQYFLFYILLIWGVRTHPTHPPAYGPASDKVIGVSRPPVLDCGTTFHLDYGGRDLPSTPSDNLWKLIYLATEALTDSFEFIGAVEISLSIYLSI